MPPRRKLVAFRGPLTEHFDTITWDEATRREHEARRPVPTFPAALSCDWSRGLKRKDVEHASSPDRFQALVGRHVGGHLAIYFVVYTKEHLVLRLISIRFANADERQVFLRV